MQEFQWSLIKLYVLQQLSVQKEMELLLVLRNRVTTDDLMYDQT